MSGPRRCSPRRTAENTPVQLQAGYPLRSIAQSASLSEETLVESRPPFSRPGHSAKRTTSPRSRGQPQTARLAVGATVARLKQEAREQPVLHPGLPDWFLRDGATLQ